MTIDKSMIEKLEQMLDRHEELASLLSDADVISNQNLFVSYSKEYSELETLVQLWKQYQQVQEELQSASELLSDEDEEMRALAEEEHSQAQSKLEEIQAQLQVELLPKDPKDNCSAYLEIRAGTGGDEAALFANDLFRMYSRYAESQNWQVEVLSSSPSPLGGYKEIIARVGGKEVYAFLKFESGAHRVQRVPETESQGRVHTSACTVAIMAEVENEEEININKEDLRIDTFRSSGAGGQHVNTTDSAIRITHLPTGLVVECQDERSQHKNKAKAMRMLASKLEDAQAAQIAAEIASERKSLVGSGDRSERIRTYNYPQGRLTDHRINLTLYKLEEILNGNLDEVIQPLRRQHQADLLLNLNAE